jgi:HD superfamily phosphohydrolase
MAYKRKRIRDPLHNLIEFRPNHFEHVMWRVLQTRPFQRLRRIKQLGFSELVYPGATHTRFAHSLGAFHTARMLVNLIESQLGEGESEPPRAKVALAAALVHDLGHGPFSHAFEDVGRRLNLKMADHERVSDLLIRDSEVSEPLKEMGSGFASDVADVIASSGPKNIYDAVVSSQFDADRLDYMRRDRLMTGTHHGAIDFEWLLSNIEIGEVSYGVDEQRVGTLKTFVLGPKATYAAESYLLGLFQLYPTVYFHKATRGAEKLFSEILFRVIHLALEGSIDATGLSASHPLIQFAQNPNEISKLLKLDDTVLWGALSMMVEARDQIISDFSRRLRDRELFRCYDVRDLVAKEIGDPASPALIDAASGAILQRVKEWLAEKCGKRPRVLIDEAEREPYRRFQESKGPLNQIMLSKGNGVLVDVATLSNVVAAIQPLKLFRLYTARNDDGAIQFIESAIAEESRRANG